jgi:hypothetical protein
VKSSDTVDIYLDNKSIIDRAKLESKAVLSQSRHIHLEPWQRSISSVGPSISVYYDIEIETFDTSIERYEMTFDIHLDCCHRRYRRFHRYR